MPRPAGDVAAGTWIRPERPGGPSGRADLGGADLGGAPPGGGDGPGGWRRGSTPRLPPVRLAPREELAAAARVAPLLRAAQAVRSARKDAGAVRLQLDAAELL